MAIEGISSDRTITVCSSSEPASIQAMVTPNIEPHNGKDRYPCSFDHVDYWNSPHLNTFRSRSVTRLSPASLAGCLQCRTAASATLPGGGRVQDRQDRYFRPVDCFLDRADRIVDVFPLIVGRVKAVRASGSNGDVVSGQDQMSGQRRRDGPSADYRDPERQSR
jgi:hypothetical protein